MSSGGRVHLKCPASLENLEERAALGPYSQGQLFAGLHSSPLPYPGHGHSGSRGFPRGGNFFLLHSQSLVALEGIPV